MASFTATRHNHGRSMEPLTLICGSDRHEAVRFSDPGDARGAAPVTAETPNVKRHIFHWL